MSIKDAAIRLYQRLFINSDRYLKYLRSRGVTIGEDVIIHSPNDTHIDVTDPHLVSIGNHVNMTGPVTILTHDYSWSVIKGKYGEIFGNEKPVTIGNNVFIGWGATILCGTTIEDNVIIGAHSVVSGHIKGDSVWGGVPAKRLCSLKQYRDKRAAAQVVEAKEYVRLFRKRWGRDPKPDEIREYFMLFIDKEHLCKVHESQLLLMGSYQKSINLINVGRPYEDFDAFLKDC